MENELVLAALSALTRHTAANKLSNFLIKPPQTEANLPSTLQAASYPTVNGFQEENQISKAKFFSTH